MNKEAFYILQYNMHKSRDRVMATFLRNPNVLQADVIAVQEPWRNTLNETTHQPAARTHQLLYPKQSETGGPETRVALYVTKKMDPSNWIYMVIS